ncbi:MAG: CDGSH iron-sulfur domain-containing protein [Lentimicrobium sp.]
MLIRGDCRIKYPDGAEAQLNLVNAFCRCGHSQNKPYCDGSHHEAGFRG